MFAYPPSGRPATCGVGYCDSEKHLFSLSSYQARSSVASPGLGTILSALVVNFSSLIKFIAVARQRADASVDDPTAMSQYIYLIFCETLQPFSSSTVSDPDGRDSAPPSRRQTH